MHYSSLDEQTVRVHGVYPPIKLGDSAAGFESYDDFRSRRRYRGGIGLKR